MHGGFRRLRSVGAVLNCCCALLLILPASAEHHSTCEADLQECQYSGSVQCLLAHRALLQRSTQRDNTGMDVPISDRLIGGVPPLDEANIRTGVKAADAADKAAIEATVKEAKIEAANEPVMVIGSSIAGESPIAADIHEVSLNSSIHDWIFNDSHDVMNSSSSHAQQDRAHDHGTASVAKNASRATLRNETLEHQAASSMQPSDPASPFMDPSIAIPQQKGWQWEKWIGLTDIGREKDCRGRSKQARRIYEIGQGLVNLATLVHIR